MAATSNISPTAISYAKALLELAGDDPQAIETGDELRDLDQILEASPTFAAFLADPGIGAGERTAALERIFSGKVSPLMWNFLRVLNGHGRLGLLRQIAAAYHDMLDERLGKVEVDLTVAGPLSDEQVAAAKQKIGAALQKDAIIHTYVDEAIIGGVIVRVEDKLLDASVRYQLQAMKEQLLAKIPK